MMPPLYGLDRNMIRDLLYERSRSRFRTTIGQEMPGLLSGWLATTVQFACCDLAFTRKRNDVFRRAALLGYGWGRGGGTNHFHPEALLELITYFLRLEGARLLPERTEAEMVAAVSSQIDDLVKEHDGGDWMLFCDSLYELLAEQLAHHWIASHGARMCLSPAKLCHQAAQA